MDNRYTPVEFDVIYLDVQDIITTSGGAGNDNNGDGGDSDDF